MEIDTHHHHRDDHVAATTAAHDRRRTAARIKRLPQGSGAERTGTRAHLTATFYASTGHIAVRSLPVATGPSRRAAHWAGCYAADGRIRSSRRRVRGGPQHRQAVLRQINFRLSALRESCRGAAEAFAKAERRKSSARTFAREIRKRFEDHRGDVALDDADHQPVRTRRWIALMGNAART